MIEERYLNAKRALFDKAYGDLNDRQREAVFTVNDPLLVLAGAGSGKTTVLVRRIAFIVRFGNAYMSDYVPYGVDEAQVHKLERALDLSPEDLLANVLPEFANHPCEPWRVLAITFTNKAAGEIKERLEKMFPDGEAADEICTGTFHSVCVRILRRFSAERLGYKANFTIYDADDAKRAVLKAMERCNIDEKLLPVKGVMNEISRAKDKLMTPDLYEAEAGTDYRRGQIAKIYEAYQMLLRDANAMDFDDLIMQTVILLRNHQDVRESYQKRFRYVCVDEFQDTNVAQLALTMLLSDGYRNLMVVGDDDQSIYRFRGATVENILQFDKTYPSAKVVKLEQNYRSTQNILDAANAVIGNNTSRHDKTLWTAKGAGEKIRLTLVDDQIDEGREIVDTVIREVAAKRASYRDFAVLYRTNAQSQSIEKAFARSGVPYRVLCGTRFTDRKEIRDAVAYLQLIENSADNLRLQRIINEPKRKIGDKTLEAIAMIAAEQGCSQFEVIEHAGDYVALARSAPTLLQFADLMHSLTDLAGEKALDVLFDEVLDRSGYRKMLEDEVLGGKEPEKSRERLDNLKEFKSGIIEYMEANDEPTLAGFLEETALVADVDKYDEDADAVVMMTIHSAKGLEFPHVFLPGMEDGLFPGMQTVTAGEAEMEEERRLAYVAITRAKSSLSLLHTRTRLLYGQTMYNPLSRFVSEIPEKLLEKKTEKREEFSPSHSGGARSIFSSDVSVQAKPRTYYRAPEPESVEKITVGKPLNLPKPTAGKVTFAPGDRVRHATFGEGDVLSAKKMGADILYEIVFDRVGTKKLMATYARLEKI